MVHFDRKFGLLIYPFLGMYGFGTLVGFTGIYFLFSSVLFYVASIRNSSRLGVFLTAGFFYWLRPLYGLGLSTFIFFDLQLSDLVRSDPISAVGLQAIFLQPRCHCGGSYIYREPLNL
jgi:hypothetical protein